MIRLFTLIYLFTLCFSINSYGQELTIKDCFLENKIRTTNRIIEDQYGFIWWAREDGFYRFDGKEFNFIDPSVDCEEESFYASANITPQPNGNYWFASREKGVLYYDVKKDTFQHIPILIDNDSSFYLYSRHVTIVPEKGIFLSGENGIWHLDENKNLIQRIQPSKIFGHKTTGRHNVNQIRKTLYDSKRDILWIGGMVGLLSYNFSNNKLNRHLPPFNNVKTKDNYFLINDLILQNNLLTMTTWGGGIQTYDIEKNVWQQFIFPDENHIDYRSGNTQLGKAPDGRFFTAHEIRELGSWKPGEPNLSIPKINKNTIGRGVGTWVDRLGYLWVGHWEKTCKYIITNKPPIEKTSQIYVNKISSNQTALFQRMQHWDNQNLFLDKKTDTLSIVFRAINPLNYDSIFYEYRLEGFDEKWKKNGVSEIATFSKLNNGEYIFQARYFDFISQKYIYTGKVSITIDQKNLFSQRVVYNLLIIVFINFLGFLYYRHLAQKKRRKAAKKYETQLREIQDAALRSQMNPHFLFNSLNSIRYFIVTNDNDKAAGYLTKFSRLIRMILENSKKKLVSLGEEIQLLELYVKMEQIRFENKFDYEVNLAADINKNEVMLPPMLIQPYIENAIIHGINPKDDRGKIILNFKLDAPFLVIEIEDDGIGRMQSMQHKKESVFKKKSLGLSITKARLDLADTRKHKADLKIIDMVDEQKIGIGTKVIIRLPV